MKVSRIFIVRRPNKTSRKFM